MTTTTANGAAGIAGRSRMLAALGAAFAGWWSAWQAHRQRRASEQLLRSLDDRTLKDIGLDRSEIGSLFAADVSDRLVSRRVQPRQLRNL